MHKMQFMTRDEEKALEAKFGKWGELPPNMKPITEDEFWGKFLNYAPDTRIHRQIHKPTFRSLTIFTYNDGTGLVLEDQVKNTVKTVPKFYSCAVCEHEYDWVHKGNCYREGTCTKCDHKTSIDSSG